jgi:peptidoglycan/LPS O-acetylase OafA/YrhL
MFGSWPFAFIGSISYGMYLYHVQIMWLVRDRTDMYDMHILPYTAAITVAVSWLSFRYYENPIIRWGHSITTPEKRGTATDTLPQRTEQNAPHLQTADRSVPSVEK